MFSLPDLPYDYNGLAPYINEQMMTFHHKFHHQTYTDRANAAVANTQWSESAPCEILTDLEAIPEDIRQGIINNVGGFCNHSFFWIVMRPPSSENEPTGKLKKAIQDTFGGIEEFKDKFSAAAGACFGSGWAWLVLDQDGQLQITSTANQDSPLSLGHKRILGLDVWEHAYYLQYQNRRPEYIENFWHVVNWPKVAELMDQGGI